VIRTPLTPEQRAELDAAEQDGNRARILLAPEDCPIDILADPGKPDGAVVIVADESLTPDDARRAARALLELADWAEFGPGEFDSSGAWAPYDPIAPA
jgi:hypothetical protein